MRFVASAAFLCLCAGALPGQGEPSAFIVDIYPRNLKPSTTAWKDQTWVSYTVEIVNASWFQAVGAHENAIVYSTDKTITTSDHLLQVLSSKGIGWALYQRWTSGFRVQKSWLRNGTAYFGCYADRRNQIKETNEGNNTISVPVTGSYPHTDVTCSYFQSPTTWRAGTSGTVRIRISNLGGMTASNVLTGIFFSSNATITTSDVFLGRLAETIPAHGTGLIHNVSVHVPCSGSPGTRYLAVWADYGKWLKSEENRSNDILKKAITVSAPLGTTMQIEYLPSLYSHARSYALSEIFGRYGGSAGIALCAPRASRGYALCAWSLSRSPFRIDAATSISLGLLNNRSWFPGWFGAMSTSGFKYPTQLIPKGTAVPSTMTLYTHAIFWDSSFRFLGMAASPVTLKLYR